MLVSMYPVQDGRPPSLSPLQPPPPDDAGITPNFSSSNNSLNRPNTQQSSPTTTEISQEQSTRRATIMPLQNNLQHSSLTIQVPPVRGHTDRLVTALSKIRLETRQDSPALRIWNILILAIVTGAFLRFTIRSMRFGGHSNELTYSIIGFIESACLIVDWALQMFYLHPTDRRKISRFTHVWNFFSAFPYDVFLVPLSSEMPNGLRLALYAIPATRVLTIPWLFPSDS
eukprot:PhF_6_TR20001/c0_g1_i2/m.29189